ncbi:MAG: fibronectin type III domain-containing protein [Candidatus Kapaibacterium sp.]
MKAIIRYKISILSLFILCICSIASSFAQNVISPIAPPPAIIAKGIVTQALNKKAAAPQGQLDVYSIGDPTPEEQLILELINQARANPKDEGVRLATTTDPDVSQGWTYWLGQNAAETRAQVQTDFSTYPVQPPLAFNSSLIDAARIHDQDMLDHNFQDHPGTDGSTPQSRALAAGYGSGYVGEDIFAYGTTPLAIHQTLQIDWGPNNVGVLGHRKNIMNFDPNGPHYTEIGIGLIHGGTGVPNVGPTITTEDFGDAGMVFITGVVYGDDNKNNFYDIGEGLAGVTITVSGGTTTAVSSTSGGYAIPYTNNESVTVTASGGPLTAPISHNVTLDGVNVKVDFIQGQTGYPDQPILLAPIAGTVIHTDTANFSWKKSTGETKYWIQVATDIKMTKLVLKDTSTTPPRMFPKSGSKEKALIDGTTYYWQAKSKNVIGWGKFSPVDSFSVGLPPKAVVLVSPADKANTGTTDVIFNWHRTNPDATDYVLEVATDAKLTKIISNDTLNFGITFDDTTFTITATDLQPQTTYYWSVLADNDNGWNAPAIVRSFKTGGVSSVASQAGPAIVSVSPNPTSGETHLRFSIGRSADVSFKVFGVTGIEDSFSNLGTLEPNTYDILWDATRKSAGVYLYELSIGNSRETGRIIVAK